MKKVYLNDIKKGDWIRIHDYNENMQPNVFGRVVHIEYRSPFREELRFAVQPEHDMGSPEKMAYPLWITVREAMPLMGTIYDEQDIQLNQLCQ